MTLSDIQTPVEETGVRSETSSRRIKYSYEMNVGTLLSETVHAFAVSACQIIIPIGKQFRETQRDRQTIPLT